MQLIVNIPRDFNEWKDVARALLQRELPARRMTWEHEQGFLPFAEPGEVAWRKEKETAPRAELPPAFMTAARWVAHHRDPSRWELMYQVAFRLVHQKRSLKGSSDSDILKFNRMEQAVKRDSEKMKTLLRFVRSESLSAAVGRDCYSAWYEPEHEIIPLLAPFFAKRFSGLHWQILSPGASVEWNGKTLSYKAGVKLPPPDISNVKHLWREHYRAAPPRTNVISLRPRKRTVPSWVWENLSRPTKHLHS